jgi:acyl-CoA thioester hydrolase
MDTDAAGIWHHTTVVRWAEEAEAELHRQLGIVKETFGATPRVRSEFNFHAPLRFDDIVAVMLAVDRVGDSSVTYSVQVLQEDRVVADGQMVAVLIDPKSGQKRPWPERLRKILSPSGDDSD